MEFVKKAVNTKEKYIIVTHCLVSINSENIPFNQVMFRLSAYEIHKLLSNLCKQYSDYKFYYIEERETIISTFSPYPYIYKLKLIKNIFEEYGLIDNLIFIDNNLSNYTIDETNIESFPFFIGNTIHDRLNLNKERVFKKNFICLNSSQKPHRDDLVKFIKIFREKTYLSYKPLESADDSIKLDDINEYADIHEWEHKITYFYETSFINIVTETSPDDNLIFFTEKTDKAITAGQPFIIFAGGPHYLKKLKELGFKTFDKWWDESYDNELDYQVRLEKIKTLIKKLSLLSLDECHEMYNEMLPHLIHNQKKSLTFKESPFNNMSWELY